MRCYAWTCAVGVILWTVGAGLFYVMPWMLMNINRQTMLIGCACMMIGVVCGTWVARWLDRLRPTTVITLAMLVEVIWCLGVVQVIITPLMIAPSLIVLGVAVGVMTTVAWLTLRRLDLVSDRVAVVVVTAASAIFGAVGDRWLITGGDEVVLAAVITSATLLGNMLVNYVTVDDLGCRLRLNVDTGYLDAVLTDRWTMIGVVGVGLLHGISAIVLLDGLAVGMSWLPLVVAGGGVAHLLLRMSGVGTAWFIGCLVLSALMVVATDRSVDWTMVSILVVFVTGTVAWCSPHVRFWYVSPALGTCRLLSLTVGLLTFVVWGVFS